MALRRTLSGHRLLATTFDEHGGEMFGEDEIGGSVLMLVSPILRRTAPKQARSSHPAAPDWRRSRREHTAAGELLRKLVDGERWENECMADDDEASASGATTRLLTSSTSVINDSPTGC